MPCRHAVSRTRVLTQFNLARQLGSKQHFSTSRRNVANTESTYAESAPSRSPTPPIRSQRYRFLAGLGACLIVAGGWFYYDRAGVRSSFVTYRLVSKEPVSSTASIFHLEPEQTSQDFELYRQAWKQGIWNVHFIQPQIQIVRAYTPLPPAQATDGGKAQQLRFLIRHDPHGEVSSYLHRLPVGSTIELRGPNVEYQLSPDVKQVVFFAGGTGIAPALQIAHAMFGSESGQQGSDAKPGAKRKLHILWASRKREDCLGGVSDAQPTDPLPPKMTWSGMLPKPKQILPESTSNEQGLLVQELEELKSRYPGQITVEYFVNAEGTWIDDDAVFQSLSRFDDKDFSSGYATSQEQRQILISGPNGFITYLAGPKEWKNGREEQGPVSRIVAHAIAQNPHHVKVWKV